MVIENKLIIMKEEMDIFCYYESVMVLRMKLILGLEKYYEC